MDDVLTIVDWAERLRESVDGLMPVNRPWTAQVVAGLIQNPQALVLISGDQGRGGFLAGSMQPTVVNPAQVAMEHGWHANDGSGIMMLRRFERRAAEHGAFMVKMSTGATGPDLSRLGYTMTERTWVKRV